MQSNFRAIGTFSSRREAEKALVQLRNSGFAMDRVSVLTKDSNRSESISDASMTDRGDNEAQEGAGIGAVTGTVLGGIGGLLVGLEALLIPGVGPFLAAGTIATTLAGAGIGAAGGALVGALTGAGIPEEDAQLYSEQVSRGDYLVMLEGSKNEIDRASSILQSSGIRGWNVYDISNGRRDTGIGSTHMNRNTQTYVDKTAVNNDAVVEIIDERKGNVSGFIG
ncbi:Heat induced stress protein YflT [Dulcicalothrix desertica PCC 7102]|nr:Heat induced stress protein YflT [Dulcicalothrix desertica PCC 7102]